MEHRGKQVVRPGWGAVPFMLVAIAIAGRVAIAAPPAMAEAVQQVTTGSTGAGEGSTLRPPPVQHVVILTLWAPTFPKEAKLKRTGPGKTSQVVKGYVVRVPRGVPVELRLEQINTFAYAPTVKFEEEKPSTESSEGSSLFSDILKGDYGKIAKGLLGDATKSAPAETVTAASKRGNDLPPDGAFLNALSALEGAIVVLETNTRKANNYREDILGRVQATESGKAPPNDYNGKLKEWLGGLPAWVQPSDDPNQPEPIENQTTDITAFPQKVRERLRTDLAYVQEKYGAVITKYYAVKGSASSTGATTLQWVEAAYKMATRAVETLPARPEDSHAITKVFGDLAKTCQDLLNAKWFWQDDTRSLGGTATYTITLSPRPDFKELPSHTYKITVVPEAATRRKLVLTEGVFISGLTSPSYAKVTDTGGKDYVARRGGEDSVTPAIGALVHWAKEDGNPFLVPAFGIAVAGTDNYQYALGVSHLLEATDGRLAITVGGICGKIDKLAGVKVGDPYPTGGLTEEKFSSDWFVALSWRM